MIILSIAAQKNAVITFTQTTHDFGTFDESEGKVTTEFEFKNTGNAPLLITRTAASCGCTTPEYPKEPIAPGKSGVIKVTYNAKGRPGAFQKTVYVFANTDPEKNTLIIKGKVTPQPPKPEDNFPKQIGELRLKTKHVPFYDVYPDSEKEEVIEVYNPTNKAMTLEAFDMPKYMTVTIQPTKIPAKGEGKLVLTYAPEKAKDWGIKRDEFRLAIDGNRSIADNKISCSADIREDFSKMSDSDRKNAPVHRVSRSTVDFGKVKSKSQETVILKNNGKSNLLIRKVRTDNEMFTVDLSKRTISPGKTAELKISIDPSKAKSSIFNERIFIITNDPEAPTTALKLVGTVD